MFVFCANAILRQEGVGGATHWASSERTRVPASLSDRAAWGHVASQDLGRMGELKNSMPHTEIFRD